MSLRSVLLLIVAAAVAFGAVSVGRRYVGQAAPAQAAERVLIARSDIAKGGFVQMGKNFDWDPVPAGLANDPGLLHEGAVEPEKLNGAIARRAITRGEPMRDALLVKPSEGGFMAAVLEPGKRAISIPVDATSGNAGFIFPGDHVDLIVTHKVSFTPPAGTEQAAKEMLASETFVEDVRVLAVDQKVSNADNTAILAKTVTMEVSKNQAEKINVAKDLGSISLALRSYSVDGAPPPPPTALDGPGYARDSDVSKIMTPTENTNFQVDVFHGDKHEKMEFAQP